MQEFFSFLIFLIFDFQSTIFTIKKETVLKFAYITIQEVCSCNYFIYFSHFSFSSACLIKKKEIHPH